MAREIPSLRRSRLDVAMAVLSLVGVATIFLPFAYDVSPLRVARLLFEHPDARDALALASLAVPFALSLLISAAWLRAVVWGRPSRVEVLVGYAAGSLAAAAILVTLSPLLHSETFRSFAASTLLLAALAAAALMLGGGLAFWLRRHGASSAALAIVVMQWAYISNVVLCLDLVRSWDRAEIGAVASVFSVALYLCHTILVVARTSYRMKAREGDGFPAKGPVT